MSFWRFRSRERVRSRSIVRNASKYNYVRLLIANFVPRGSCRLGMFKISTILVYVIHKSPFKCNRIFFKHVHWLNQTLGLGLATGSKETKAKKAKSSLNER